MFLRLLLVSIIYVTVFSLSFVRFLRQFSRDVAGAFHDGVLSSRKRS